MCKIATLYIVATPIGNLQDITLRALETLRSVDLILAEDTRRARILLSHYQIKTPCVSFHQYTSSKKLNALISKLKKGLSLALITEAGTPNISDPGLLLIKKAYKLGFKVVPVPGPSAITTLLSVVNFEVSQFVFLGFLPKKKGRKKALEKVAEFLKKYSLPVVIFESPNRLLKLLSEIEKMVGLETKIVLGRELTKVFEGILFDSPAGLKERFKEKQIKGEFTLVILPPSGL